MNRLTLRTAFFLSFFTTLLLCFQARAQVSEGISIKSNLAPESFNIIKHRTLAPISPFLNERGQKLTLEDFKGKILLVNIWTTSCSQCVVELPLLDRLQKDMGGMKFQVLALSSDLEPITALRRFYGIKGIKHLNIYTDAQGLFSRASDVRGLPTTFLIDEKGRIAGRIKGIAEWDSPKIKAQIRELIRQSKKPKEKASLSPSKETIKMPASENTVEKPLSNKEIKSWFTKK